MPLDVRPGTTKRKQSDLFRKYKAEKSTEKRKARKARKKEAEDAEERGLPPPPKQARRTLDNTREADDTVVDPGDREVSEDVRGDEFSSYFSGEREPHVVITTSVRAKGQAKRLAKLLARILHNAECHSRRFYTLDEITTFANNREYTDVVVLNENGGKCTDMLVSHLPNGPTAHFTVMNVMMPEGVEDHGQMTEHESELILNNFVTRLGMTVGRMFASLFTTRPQFEGRQVVTLHVQRDFVFFRHHRYIFETVDKERRKEGQPPVGARIQELGPRFTLKLRTLRLGNLADTSAEYLFVTKRDLLTSRRRFFL